MTSVQPFVPAVRANAVAPATMTSADPAEPANSFADLLDNPAAPSQKQQPRLFAFAELGMFGRHGAQALAATALNEVTAPIEQREELAATQSTDVQSGSPVQITGTHDQHVTSAQQTSTAIALQPSVAKIAEPQRRVANVQPSAIPQLQGMAQQSSKFLLVDAGSESDGQTAECLPGLERLGAATSQMTTPLVFAEPLATAAGFGVEVESSVTGSVSATGPDLPTLPSRAPNPVNLLVSGSGDSLAVAVRVASESTEDFVRLRRLVQDTAAEFGMDVAEFRLNGAATEQSFTAIAGGNHGRRAR